MATDYAGILVAALAKLKADASITSKLAPRTIGSTTSGANSIFYGDLIGAPLFPCISVRDFGPYPAVPQQHEFPMAICRVGIEVSIFGQSQHLRPIQAEVDQLMETAHHLLAMDSVDWQVNDIDTSEGWRNVKVPQELTVAGSPPVEQRVKSFMVTAANRAANLTT